MERRVSIIVPCYNQAVFLPETLDSVLAQTYQNWECIIVNDGSPDNTDEVAKMYCEKDNRFKYLYKQNGGLSSARNAGVRASSGEYVLPLDSDDIIGAEYLELAVQVLNTNSKIAVVYCRAHLFGKKKGEWLLPEFSLNKMLGCNLVFCSAVFRRIYYDKTNGYNENMKFGYEDWDFWLSIIELEGEFYRIDKVLFHYRIRSSSMARSLTTDKNILARRQLWENHRKLFAENFFNPMDSFEYSLISESKEYKLGKIVLKPIRKLLGR